MHRLIELLETSSTGALAINADDWDVVVSDYRKGRTLAGFPGEEKRQDRRYDCSQLLVGIKLSNVTTSNDLLLAKCRNLSSGGLGITNRWLIMQGVDCEMLLLNRFGETLKTKGAVRYCELQKTGQFHIGIQFYQMIDPKDYLNGVPPDAVADL